MTKLIMHFLPCSRKMSYNLSCNSCLLWLSNKIPRFPNLSLLVNCKSNLSLCIPLNGYLFKHFHQSSQKNFEDIKDISGQDEIVIPLESIIEREQHSEQLRNTLYPDSTDAIIKHLKLCDSVEQLLNVTNDNLLYLTSEHYCQFILVMWDLVRPKYVAIKSKNEMLQQNFKDNVDEQSIHNLRPIIFKALAFIAADFQRLTADALVCTVLYSSRIGVNLRHPLIQTLLTRINTLLLSEDVNKFSLSGLSRLTVLLGNQEDLWARLFLVNTMPLIYRYFDTCTSAESLKALTISLLSVLPYLKEDMLLEYRELVEELMENGTLMQDHTSAIVKSTMLLSNIYYKPTARYTVYKLLQVLSGNIDKLFMPHLCDLKWIVGRNLEPYYTIEELKDLTNDLSTHLTNVTKLPSIFLHFVTLPSDNAERSLILKNMISSTDDMETLMGVLNHLTTNQMEACHLFWDKAMKLIPSHDLNILQKVCYRYITFTTRMDSYRHRKFESYMLSLIMSEMVEGAPQHRPGVFAVLSTFVLSFDYHRYGISSLTSDIVPHLINMIGQFNLYNCLLLSRGLKLGMKCQRNREIQLYLQLDSALNIRTKEMIAMDDISIHTYNVLLRSCINRTGSSENDLLLEILKRSNYLDWTQLTSRSLRNLVYNLNSTRSLVPVAMDHMVDYCLQNKDYILGDTVGKLADLCYYLGYTTPHSDSFCALTAELAIRDCNIMNGLTLLKIALSLSFLNHLPSSLISIIFTVKFLERLDEEIKHCYCKDKYPIRVRQTLMQLNRSVCLDQPESDVPWFHTKFCQEQISLGHMEKKHKSLMFMEVFSTLMSLVGDSSCINTMIYVPYGYSIDILLNLDAALNPVPIKETDSSMHKIAFLLHHSNDYTTCVQRLMGYHQLKQRHLEILGYRVINIPDSIWNAMFMSEPKAKQEYLRNLIWPS